MLPIISTPCPLMFISVTGKLPQSKKETINCRIWHCSVCTYDNDESLSACDICGVLRNASIYSGTDSDKKAGMQLYLIIVHIILPSVSSASGWTDPCQYLVFLMGTLLSCIPAFGKFKM